MGKEIIEANFESFEPELDKFLEKNIDGFSGQPDFSSCFHSSQIISKAPGDPAELFFCKAGIPKAVTHSSQKVKNKINIITRFESSINDFHCLIILIG